MKFNVISSGGGSSCKIKDTDRWVRNQIQFCGSLDTHFITTRSISHATHCHRKALATVLAGEEEQLLTGEEAEASVICSLQNRFSSSSLQPLLFICRLSIPDAAKRPFNTVFNSYLRSD